MDGMSDNLQGINNPVFTLYRHYSDGSGQPDFIYMGCDKAKAFDALMDYAKREYFDSNNLKLVVSVDVANG